MVSLHWKSELWYVPHFWCTFPAFSLICSLDVRWSYTSSRYQSFRNVWLSVDLITFPHDHSCCDICSWSYISFSPFLWSFHVLKSYRLSVLFVLWSAILLKLQYTWLPLVLRAIANILVMECLYLHLWYFHHAKIWFSWVFMLWKVGSFSVVL